MMGLPGHERMWYILFTNKTTKRAVVALGR
jgi:hypothetical protein